MKNQTSLGQNIWPDSPKVDEKTALWELLLRNSNLQSPGEIKAFLAPRASDLHDPFLMSGMDIAVDRIQEAIQKKERIMVYGDFDTDGITSTVILVQGLRDLGAEVSYRIPCRVNDSHGLKIHHIDEIISKDVQLLITCDCGINDYQEVAYAKSLGLDVIITDHHDPDPDRFPKDAVAVLNPLQHNCNYPCKTLSGAGVALKLIQALNKNIPSDSLLEVAAIGTIADCVPLQGESRNIAKLGLTEMKNTQWSGLRKLLELTDTTPEEIDESTVGFTIAPRLNAASRLGDVTRAVELFLGGEQKHTERIEYLEKLNQQRKEKTEQTLQEALIQIEKDQSFQLLYKPGWEQGILGLVAGRIYEKINQPVVLARKANDRIVASCRAPLGYSMIQALRTIDDLLGQYGGHDGAAGFEAPIENKDAITKALNLFFSQQEVNAKALPIQASINPSLVDYETADLLQSLAPFGVGNPSPIFCFESVQVIEKQWMGQGENHFKIVGMKNDQVLDFLVFFRPEWFSEIAEESVINIAFNINESWWRGERQLKLKVVDINQSNRG